MCASDDLVPVLQLYCLRGHYHVSWDRVVKPLQLSSSVAVDNVQWGVVEDCSRANVTTLCMMNVKCSKLSLLPGTCGF